MMLVGIILLSGAECISPVSIQSKMTVAYQVPCANVVYEHVGNPFKSVQEQNVISVVPPKKASKLCGAKTAVWYVKNNKRRYRCK